MMIGNRQFNIGSKTFVMGILNVTPDSFYDGNQYNNLDSAILRAKEMIANDVDIIDIGGESTRPNYVEISVEEELNRVLPVIKAIRSFSNIPLSIDTYKPLVAKKAIEKGIDMVNDIWGLQNPQMQQLLSTSKKPVIIMHNNINNIYVDIIQDMKVYFEQKINSAIASGISKDSIIIDVGIGFSKTTEQNLLVIKNLEEFQTFGVPVMLASSNKSVFLAAGFEKNDRLEATVASSVIAVNKKCDFVRVHNVAANVKALRFADIIYR